MLTDGQANHLADPAHVLNDWARPRASNICRAWDGELGVTLNFDEQMLSIKCRDITVVLRFPWGFHLRAFDTE